MWYLLWLLSLASLPSLTELKIKIEPFNMVVDTRGYTTMFRETTKMISKASPTLESLTIILGEDIVSYDTEPTGLCRSQCESTVSNYRAWYLRIAKLFLNEILTALETIRFRKLKQISFKGFHCLHAASSTMLTDSSLQPHLILCDDAHMK